MIDQWCCAEPDCLMSELNRETRVLFVESLRGGRLRWQAAKNAGEMLS